MSRIGDGDDGFSSGAAQSSEGDAEVGKLRRAITARMDGEPVDTEVAPLLPDLLTRPEALTGSSPPGDLRAPEPIDAADPPSPSDQLHLLRGVESKLEEAAAELGHTERGRAVELMVDTLRKYRGLKEEVLMRSEFA